MFHRSENGVPEFLQKVPGALDYDNVTITCIKENRESL